MEKLVLTGTVCFCVGLTVGLILGAAMGDCDHCPVNGGDDVPKQGSLPLNFAEHIMNRFMERI